MYVDVVQFLVVDMRIFGVVSRMRYFGAEQILDFGRRRWPKERRFGTVREVAERRSDSDKMALLIDFAGGYDDDIQFLIDREVNVS